MEYLTLKQAREILPGRPTIKTLRCWIYQGLAGGRVRLACVRVGGRVYVTRDGLDRFAREIQAEKSRPKGEEVRETFRRRRREDQAARERLRAMGIKC